MYFLLIPVFIFYKAVMFKKKKMYVRMKYDLFNTSLLNNLKNGSSDVYKLQLWNKMTDQGSFSLSEFGMYFLLVLCIKITRKLN